jgi:flagellar protein FliT
MFARTRSDTQLATGLYQTVQVDTGVANASPHQLVALLFEGFIAACAQARGAMLAGNVAIKGRAIGRAVRIVEEGLRAGLNLRPVRLHHVAPDPRQPAQRRARGRRMPTPGAAAAGGMEGHRRAGRTHTVPLMNRPAMRPIESTTMDTELLHYYEAIERASADMLSAARAGNWDEVVKLEGACVLLISQLKQAAKQDSLSTTGAQQKARLMHRILINDAEVRNLAEPWLDQLDHMLTGKARTLH